MWWWLAAVAFAGDPCPIPLEFATFTPEWRDASKDLAALKSKRGLLGMSYGVRGDQVQITSVKPGSAADKAGVKEGLNLVAVADTPVFRTEEVNDAIDALEGAPVPLQLTDGARVLQLTVTPEPADPVLLGLVNRAEQAECRQVSLKALTEAERKEVAAAVFDENRAFRCEDAHTRLASKLPSQTVLVVRGGTRLLWVQPAFSSTCVYVEDYDGAGLTADKLDHLLETVTAAYVKDRHDNP